jgi:hypothetical protein
MPQEQEGLRPPATLPALQRRRHRRGRLPQRRRGERSQGTLWTSHGCLCQEELSLVCHFDGSSSNARLPHANGPRTLYEHGSRQEQEAQEVAAGPILRRDVPICCIRAPFHLPLDAIHLISHRISPPLSSTQCYRPAPQHALFPLEFWIASLRTSILGGIFSAFPVPLICEQKVFFLASFLQPEVCGIAIWCYRIEAG